MMNEQPPQAPPGYPSPAPAQPPGHGARQPAPFSANLLNSPQEERLAAAAAYLTWLAGFWLIGPIVLFFLFREKSRFVAFHAMQSIVVSIGVSILVPVLWILGMVVTMLVGLASGGGAMSGVIIVVMYLGWALLLFVLLIFMVLGAWRAFHGHWWRVPIAAGIADRLVAQPIVDPNQAG